LSANACSRGVPAIIVSQYIGRLHYTCTASRRSQTSWVAVTSFKPSSHPKPDRLRIACTSVKFFLIWAGRCKRRQVLSGSTHTLVLIFAFGGSLLAAGGSGEVRGTVGPDLRLPAAVRLKAIGFAPTETVEELDLVHISPLGTRRHVLGRKEVQ
jgi:hypothetical protein